LNGQTVNETCHADRFSLSVSVQYFSILLIKNEKNADIFSKRCAENNDPFIQPAVKEHGTKRRAEV
jgi:hypothetical protein